MSGGAVGRDVFELVDVGGRLVTYGAASGHVTPLGSADLYRSGATASAAIGARLFSRPGGLRPLESRALEAAAAGALTPLTDIRLALDRAPEAHRLIEAR